MEEWQYVDSCFLVVVKEVIRSVLSMHSNDPMDPFHQHNDMYRMYQEERIHQVGRQEMRRMGRVEEE